MRTAYLSALAIACLMPAFAAADKAGAGGAPSPTPTPTPIPEAAVAAAPAGVQSGVKTGPVRMDVPPPTKRQGTRGGQTLYDFDSLDIGGSFAVFDKTAKAVSSTVASANKRYVEEVKDQAGAVIMIDDPKKPGTKKAMTRVTKKFVSAATDPKTDPDKAPVRIWRIAV